MQDPDYIKFFFKSISSDGQKVTVEDVRRMLKQFNLIESLAQEYVERTSGIHRATSFNLAQLQEVLQGKRRPENETEAKKREEARKND